MQTPQVSVASQELARVTRTCAQALGLLQRDLLLPLLLEHHLQAAGRGRGHDVDPSSRPCPPPQATLTSKSCSAALRSARARCPSAFLSSAKSLTIWASLFSSVRSALLTARRMGPRDLLPAGGAREGLLAVKLPSNAPLAPALGSMTYRGCAAPRRWTPAPSGSRGWACRRSGGRTAGWPEGSSPRC